MRQQIVTASLMFIIWILSLALPQSLAVAEDKGPVHSRLRALQLSTDIDFVTSSDSIIDDLTYEAPQFFDQINYGAFEGVTFKLRPNVVVANSVFNEATLQRELKLDAEIDGPSLPMTPQMKLSLGALVSKDALAPLQAETGQALGVGSIIVDETNRVAFKIASISTQGGNGYYKVERPELFEVFQDYVIPRQAVYLTRDNLTAASEEISNAISTPAKGQAGDAIEGQFQDPLIVLKFQDQTFNIETTGSTVQVVLDGVLVIDKIRLDGEYSCFGGYQFQVSIGEGIGLDVDVKSNIDEELFIPLFAIDVPAGIGDVRGGLYLIVGLNGKFTIGVNMGEWAKASLGLRGGTKFCVPHSFRPIGSFEKDLFGDASFAGEINGEIKAGPMVDLELFGWDVAGAGAFAGFGATCDGNITSDGFYRINAELYVPVHFYLTFVGKSFDLFKQHYILAQLQKVYSASKDSSGEVRTFDVSFNEACAYRRVVWGRVLDLDAPEVDGEPAPLSNSPVEITVTRGGSSSTYSGTTDSNGYFAIRDVDLQKGDEIRVTKLDSLPVNSMPVSPTFPFRKVTLDYVDFFDDSARGQVAPARVVDWDETFRQGKRIYTEIYYTGDIVFDINGESEYPSTQSDSQGNFYISHDFKPNHKVKAHISWNGFDYSSSEVIPDTDIGFHIVEEPIMISSYNLENEYSKGRVTTADHMTIVNLRGEKSFDGLTLQGKAYYFLMRRPYPVCVGPQAVMFTPQIGLKEFSQKVPSGSGSSDGTSEITRYFVEEWEWPASTRSNTTRSVPYITSDISSELNLDPHMVEIDTSMQDPILAGGFNPDQTWFTFSTEYNLFTDDLCNTISTDAMDSNLCAIFQNNQRFLYSMIASGNSPIRRLLTMEFQYEGAEVTIRPLDEPFYMPTCSEGPVTGTDPVDLFLRERVWSRINPSPVDVSNPVSIIDQPFLNTLDLDISATSATDITSGGLNQSVTLDNGVSQIGLSF